MLISVLIFLLTVGAEICHAAEKGCKNDPADVVFVLDGSSSIFPVDFTRQLDFVHSVIGSLDVGFNRTHVGVITFATTERVVFQLGEYTDEAQLEAAVKGMEQLTGNTYTHFALKRMREEMFSSDYSRPWVRRMAIVITDGDSTDPNKTMREAELCHQMGIRVLAVGVGSRISERELEVIASFKDSAYTVENYVSLDSLRIVLVNEVCPNYGSENVCENSSADIVFVLDESGYILKSDFTKQLKFVQGVIDAFDVGLNKTHIGVLAFSTEERVIFQLGNYTEKAELKTAVEGIQLKPGQTNTHLALRRTCEEMFSSNYSRPWVSHVAIVVTDGKSDNASETAKESASCRQKNIQVLAIGIGKAVSKKELDVIASSTYLVFTVDSYEVLQTLASTLAPKVCPLLENRPTQDISDKNSTVISGVILVVVVTILFVVVVTLFVRVLRIKSNGKPEASIQVDQRKRAASGVYDVIAYTTDDYDKIEDRDIDDDVPVKFEPRQGPLHPDPGYSSLLPEIPGKSDGYTNFKQFETTGDEEAETPRKMPNTNADVASCDDKYIEMSRAKAAQETPSAANYTSLNANVASSDYHDTETYNVGDVNEQNCGEEDAPPYLELVND